MSDMIDRQKAIDALDFEIVHMTVFSNDEKNGTNPLAQYNKGLEDGIKVLKTLPFAEPEERTAKVIEHRYFIGTALNIVGEPKFGYEYLCGKCKKKVICGDEYCSHCGARLEWSDDVSLGNF